MPLGCGQPKPGESLGGIFFAAEPPEEGSSEIVLGVFVAHDCGFAEKFHGFFRIGPHPLTAGNQQSQQVLRGRMFFFHGFSEPLDGRTVVGGNDGGLRERPRKLVLRLRGALGGFACPEINLSFFRPCLRYVPP